MTGLSGNIGFASPATDARLLRRRNTGVELIATAALAASLMVAATAVSIGAAHAQVLHGHYLSSLTRQAAMLSSFTSVRSHFH